jgi:hypothetical protein
LAAADRVARTLESVIVIQVVGQILQKIETSLEIFLDFWTKFVDLLPKTV